MLFFSKDNFSALPICENNCLPHCENNCLTPCKNNCPPPPDFINNSFFSVLLNQLQIGGEYFPGLCKQLWILYVREMCQGYFLQIFGRITSLLCFFVFFAARWNEIKLLLFIIFDLATFYTLKKKQILGLNFYLKNLKI